jgi:hypothetical protein
MTRRSALRGAAGVATLLAIGVVVYLTNTGSDGGEGATVPSGPRPQRALVLGQGSGFKPDCDPRSIANRLIALQRALQSLDEGVLKRAWTNSLEGFGVGSGDDALAVFNYADGVRDLRKRGGLELRFAEVEVNSNEATSCSRDSRWPHRWRPFFGKAGLACGSLAIRRFVAPLGRDDEARCPKPKRLRGRDFVVCAPKLG